MQVSSFKFGHLARPQWHGLFAIAPIGWRRRYPMYAVALCGHGIMPILRLQYDLRPCCGARCRPAVGRSIVLARPSCNRRNKMSQLRKFSNSPVKASSVIGTNVVNRLGDNLGDIKEVVIDPGSGRVAYAVVSFGGFLSMGEKLFAIPFSALEYNVSKSDYMLDVSKERLEDAPGFDKDHWPSMADEKWNRDVYRYYDRLPYWE